MIRTLRKNNETLQLGTLQDRRAMGSSASFPDYETALNCLRRFMNDPYNMNMTVLRRFLGENSCQITGCVLTDQEVISQVARKVAQGQFFLGRKKVVQYGGGGATPSVKEVVEPEPKKWDKTEYIKEFLREHEVDPVVPKIKIKVETKPIESVAPQLEVLKNAAVTGTPFCEICQKANNASS